MVAVTKKCYYSNTPWLMLFYFYSSTCERVRKDLNLNYKSQGLYYDLTQNDDTMKKITMLPEKMPDEVKNLLTLFYGESITELDNKLANELLVKSTPKTTAMQAQQALQV